CPLMTQSGHIKARRSRDRGAVRASYFSNIVSSKALEQHAEQQRQVSDHREPELVFGEKLDAGEVSNKREDCEDHRDDHDPCGGTVDVDLISHGTSPLFPLLRLTSPL